MAPKKFGLFKGRSRDQQEQPSTENLLQSSSTDLMVYQPSPMPSTSSGYSNDNGFADFALLHIDNSDDDDDSETTPVPRRFALAKVDEAEIRYRALPSSSSTVLDFNTIEDLQFQCQLEEMNNYELATPDDSTSIDANSIQFDVESVVSEEVKYCGAAKKPKKNKPRETQELTDEEMWLVTNREVIQRLLQRNCTLDELLKWEAIATARGICTLTTNCICSDCNGGQPPAAVTDGDAGMGTAPFLSAVSVGCNLQ